MSIYDGVVTIDENDIQVVLGVNEDKIWLSAGGLEIGEWSAEECSIDSVGDGVFTITAENETLTFVPNNPMTFSAAMNGGSTSDRAIDTPVEKPAESEMVSSSETDPVPDPKPVTMVIFYALVAITGTMGLWALISIIL